MHIKSPIYNCKLYQIIRQNGGWDNWKMEIVAFFNCKNQYEARQKEQEYYISLKATLNSVKPFGSYNKPTPTQNNVEINSKLASSQLRFLCEKCNFKCEKQSIFNKHLDTVKHKCSLHNYENNILNTMSQNSHFLRKYICPFCMTSYKYHSGLWRHKMICVNKNNYSEVDVGANNDVNLNLNINNTNSDDIKDEYKIRKLTPIECERLQTVPDNYTEGVSNTQRYKMLGNGWTVDVISHIFEKLKSL
jgi:site-specific DNA-cytosine methylase